MSTFTNLTGTIPQDKTWANEIILSYSEHRQVLGQSAVSAVSTGDDAQDKTLWLAMQTWLETYCTSFVNHNDALNVFTLATWRSVAGLNASGFSRYIDEALVGYGNIQHGDDRSVVNFQELQKGFDALWWTKATNTWSTKGENNVETEGSYYHPSWAEAKTQMEIDWGSDGPTTGTGVPKALTEGQYDVEFDPDFYFGFPVRAYGYAQASGISAVIQHSAELWIKPKATAYDDVSTLIYDNNGDIIGSDGVWGNEHSIAESASVTHEKKIGDSTFALPNWCDAPTEGFNSGRGWVPDETTWLLKWNGANGFTYTL